MNPLIAKMVARYCHDSFVITRNQESQTVLSKLGVSTELGTDTAWTFEPQPPMERTTAMIAAEGRMGRPTPVLVVCPINPFWWPVKASVGEYAATAVGAIKRAITADLLPQLGPEVERGVRALSTALAKAVERSAATPRFMILVAMEKLDASAARGSRRLATGGRRSSRPAITICTNS